MNDIISQRPKVFIGSSSEGKEISYAFQEHLEVEFEVTIWEHDVFSLTSSALDSLISATLEFDFGIFVCAPDDEVMSRGATMSAPRDNIVFETGLFIGALGADRVFLVKPIETDIKLPSDLAGISAATYQGNREDRRWSAATNTAARKCADHMRAHGCRSRKSDGAKYAAAICYRIEEGQISFLLTQTTRGRRIFPKGIILEDETSNIASLRLAGDEGGVSGRVDSSSPFVFQYLKEDRGIEQEIAANTIEMKHEFTPSEIYRDPKWYTYENALRALTDDRSARQADGLRNVLEWANNKLSDSVFLTSKIIKQAGCLPYRVSPEGDLEVMLITSTKTGNWGLPKGRIEDCEQPRETASREAFEEAGIKGKVYAKSIGNYSYSRRSLAFDIEVFPMLVKEEFAEWSESAARNRRWFQLKVAAEMSVEKELSALIIGFNPKRT